MSSILDITQHIRPDMPVYPGDPHFRSRIVCDIHTDGCEVSEWTMGSHCGTHIDAPKHMLKGGGGIEALPLECFLGPCRVLTLEDRRIGAGSLRPFDIKAGERILLRTNPRGANAITPAALDVQAAALLAETHVRLVGIDTMSIEDVARDGGEVHRILLGAGIAILEGLCLERAQATHYTLCALPLRVDGENGSPCRAVLSSEENE